MVGVGVGTAVAVGTGVAVAWMAVGVGAAVVIVDSTAGAGSDVGVAAAVGVTAARTVAMGVSSMYGVTGGVGTDVAGVTIVDSTAGVPVSSMFGVCPGVGDGVGVRTARLVANCRSICASAVAGRSGVGSIVPSDAPRTPQAACPTTRMAETTMSRGITLNRISEPQGEAGYSPIVSPKGEWKWDTAGTKGDS